MRIQRYLQQCCGTYVNVVSLHYLTDHVPAVLRLLLKKHKFEGQVIDLTQRSSPPMIWIAGHAYRAVLDSSIL